MNETKGEKRTAPPWPYSGNGCDATNGGEHTVIREGSYAFCARCGETVTTRRRKPSPQHTVPGQDT